MLPFTNCSTGSINELLQGCSPHWYSSISKLGSAAQSATDAAVETGPLGLWGETSTLNVSANAEILKASHIPPQCFMSGIMMSTARCSHSGRNPSIPNKNSPPANTWLIASRIVLVFSVWVGGTGSSYQLRLAASNSRATSMDICVSKKL